MLIDPVDLLRLDAARRTDLTREWDQSYPLDAHRGARRAALKRPSLGRRFQVIRRLLSSTQTIRPAVQTATATALTGWRGHKPGV